jgi:hypothetical protein
MIRPHAIEALSEQRDRLTELLRQMDGGRWWPSNGGRHLDEDEICVQAERIRGALDVVTRLAGELELDDGIGAGSQLVAGRSYPSVPPFLPALDGAALQEDLGPRSPGPVVPRRERIHASGGYERRAVGLLGAIPNLN